jgi:hypothetical protein
MDLKSYSRWYDYSRARMRCSLPPTRRGRRGTWRSPRDKKSVRLNIITHLLGAYPTATCRARRSSSPTAQKAHAYREPDYNYKFVPEKY